MDTENVTSASTVVKNHTQLWDDNILKRSEKKLPYNKAVNIISTWVFMPGNQLMKEATAVNFQ